MAENTDATLSMSMKVQMASPEVCSLEGAQACVQETAQKSERRAVQEERVLLDVNDL